MFQPLFAHAAGPLRRLFRGLKFGVFACVLACGGAFAETTETPDCSLGLPPLPASAQQADRDLLRLGEKLFKDRRLSRDATIACTSCHQVDLGMADGLPTARGVAGATGTRNTPTLLNAAYTPTYFWEGRRPVLEQQVIDPLLNPLEHGLTDRSELEALLRDIPDYQELLHPLLRERADTTPADLAASALAAYVRTLRSGGSAFDRFYYGGDQEALSEAARNGWDLFRGRAGCIECHPVGEDWAMFTDYQFRNAGVSPPPQGAKLAGLTRRAKALPGEAVGDELSADAELAALGRFLVTGKPKDIGRFRTPSLRDVALTAPYMHDGSVATLEEAVQMELYYQGNLKTRPVILTSAERADLIAFLESLSGCRP